MLYIGDSLHDAEAAEILGCKCLLFAGGHQYLPPDRTGYTVINRPKCSTMCNGGSRSVPRSAGSQWYETEKNRDRFLNNSAGSGRRPLRLLFRAAPPDPFGGSTAATLAWWATLPTRATPGPLHFPVPRRTSIPPSFPLFLDRPYLTCKHFRSVCKFPSCRVFPVRRIDCAVTIHLTAAYRGIFKSYPRFRTGLYSRSSGN